jgi:uncharacterized ion transporter superfamily protein YfcC
MLQKKRKLKKEKTKQRLKHAFVILVFLLMLLTCLVYLNTHFSFGRKTYLSPLAERKLIFSNSLEEELNKADIKFKTISSNSDGSQMITLEDGGLIILTSKKDILFQISSLQLILSRLTIEGKKLKTLDFRFDNPVVSF